jgi:hypothetical protein
MIAVYDIVRDRVPYQDLRADHFERLFSAQLIEALRCRLEQLGHSVLLDQ